MASDRIPFSEAVHAQPASLATAVAHIDSSLAEAELTPWRSGETVAILAMGASTNSAHAFVTALAQHGIRAANLTASEVAAYPSRFEPGDHYVIVTESGRSPEPIEAALTRGVGRRIAITNFPDASISSVADHSIGYGGIDDSPVYTAGYLSTLVAYAAVMNKMGVASGFDPASAPAIVESALERFAPVAASLAGCFDRITDADLIGRGFSYCSAAQGALIFREALRLAATGWETYQFVHGPLESLGKNSLLVVLGDGRELDVVPQVAKAGVEVIVLSAAPDDRLSELAAIGANVHTVSLAHTSPGFERTIAETVLLQLLTEAVAARQGITIEEFLYSQPDTKIPRPGESEEAGG